MRAVSIAFAFSVLFWPSSARSICNIPQPRLVCAEFFRNQLVVEATLINTREVRSKADPEGIEAFVYTLRVDRALRGEAVQKILVYEGNDSGRATFDWTRGQRYLLFLSPRSNTRSWELDGCGNSGPLSAAKAALAEIAAIERAAGGGMVHVVVSKQGSQRIEGVQIEALGSTGRYEGKTNAAGEVQIRVPAGEYLVRAEKEDLSFAKALFSYEDPKQVRIEAGGCAQIAFEAFDHPASR